MRPATYTVRVRQRDPNTYPADTYITESHYFCLEHYETALEFFQAGFGLLPEQEADPHGES